MQLCKHKIQITARKVRTTTRLQQLQELALHSDVYRYTIKLKDKESLKMGNGHGNIGQESVFAKKEIQTQTHAYTRISSNNQFYSLSY